MSPEVGPAPWNGPLRERSVTDSGISFSPKRQSDEAESRKEAERLRDSLTKVDKAVQAEDDTLVDAEGIRCQIIAGFNGCEQPPKPKLKGVARRERSRSPTSLRLLRTPIQSPGLSGRVPVHERLYARSTSARRQAESREEKVRRPKPVPDTGPAATACKRLHEESKHKQAEMARIRDKYDREFAAVATFSPSSRSDAGTPLTSLTPRSKAQFQAWISEQEMWGKKRNERRAEMVKGQEEEVEKYAKLHSVHRSASQDVDKATSRLYSSWTRSKEKLRKMRAEQLQDEMEHIQQSSVHRHLVNSPDRSYKVQTSIERLYHQDLRKREEWLLRQFDEKLKAEKEAEEKLLRNSVHSKHRKKDGREQPATGSEGRGQKGPQGAHASPVPKTRRANFSPPSPMRLGWLEWKRSMQQRDNNKLHNAKDLTIWHSPSGQSSRDQIRPAPMPQSSDSESVCLKAQNLRSSPEASQVSPSSSAEEEQITQAGNNLPRGKALDLKAESESPTSVVGYDGSSIQSIEPGRQSRKRLAERKQGQAQESESEEEPQLPAKLTSRQIGGRRRPQGFRA
ncbi:unnamed protein product [Effrenium voratum]|nr:unnamed protein product [Effrenium voratum]